jgi:PAS domain S-box-containing protein
MTQIILSVQYDWRLVALSAAIAVYASYIAFDLAARIARSRGRKEVLWIACGATVMGLGMWATQCIGMLALVLPVTVRYNVPIIAVSLLLAVAASAVALFVVTRKELSEPYLIGGSLALGGGIAAMHYAGMAAMQLAAYAVYNSGFVALSVAVAVSASCAALQLARLRDAATRPPWMRWLCAVVMAVAIIGAHYAGMAAVSLRYAQALAASPNSVSGSGLSITGIALLTLAVLALSIVGSRVDRKFSLQHQLLLSEQERWLLVASASLDGLFDFDLVSGQVFYSARWKAMLGYGPSELEPNLETWRSFIHPDDRQAVEDKLEQYLRAGQGAFEMEYRVSHRNGDTLWIAARCQAVWDEFKKPVRLVGCHSDITVRKRSEERLLASEARYRGLFEANPLPSWIYSPQTLQIQDANQAAMDYYGWTRDQFVGLNVNSISMPGAEPGGDTEPETGLRSRSKTPWRLRRKNKSGIWVELSNYEIQGTDAPAQLMLAHDVTTHVVNQTKIERAKDQLETQLERNKEEMQVVEAQWHGLAEASDQLIWSALPDGQCDYVNHQWAQYSGVPASKLLGAGWLETLHPGDRAAVEQARDKAMQTGEVYKLEYRIRSKSGSYSRFDAQIIPVRAAAGKPVIRWIGTSTGSPDGIYGERAEVPVGKEG